MMTDLEIPCLLKRCLTYGVIILPIEIKDLLRSYNKYKIPDDDLNKLNKEEMKNYVKALKLSSREESMYWVEGHDMLVGMGFTKVERVEGCKSFVSLFYMGIENEQVNVNI